MSSVSAQTAHCGAAPMNTLRHRVRRPTQSGRGRRCGHRVAPPSTPGRSGSRTGAVTSRDAKLSIRYDDDRQLPVFFDGSDGPGSGRCWRRPHAVHLRLRFERLGGLRAVRRRLEHHGGGARDDDRRGPDRYRTPRSAPSALGQATTATARSALQGHEPPTTRRPRYAPAPPSSQVPTCSVRPSCSHHAGRRTTRSGDRELSSAWFPASRYDCPSAVPAGRGASRSGRDS